MYIQSCRRAKTSRGRSTIGIHLTSPVDYSRFHNNQKSSRTATKQLEVLQVKKDVVYAHLTAKELRRQMRVCSALRGNSPGTSRRRGEPWWTAFVLIFPDVGNASTSRGGRFPVAEGGACHPVSLGSYWALLFCNILNYSDRRCRRGKCEEKDPRLIPPDEDSNPCSLALWFLFTINAGRELVHPQWRTAQRWW